MSDTRTRPTTRQSGASVALLTADQLAGALTPDWRP